MLGEVLAFGGVAVGYETVRQWPRKFGRALVNVIHDGINNLFHLPHGHLPAAYHGAARTRVLKTWAEIGSRAIAA
jgi:hypothetical protein